MLTIFFGTIIVGLLILVLAVLILGRKGFLVAFGILFLLWQAYRHDQTQAATQAAAPGEHGRQVVSIYGVALGGIPVSDDLYINRRDAQSRLNLLRQQGYPDAQVVESQAYCDDLDDERKREAHCE